MAITLSMNSWIFIHVIYLYLDHLSVSQWAAYVSIWIYHVSVIFLSLNWWSFNHLICFNDLPMFMLFDALWGQNKPLKISSWVLLMWSLITALLFLGWQGVPGVSHTYAFLDLGSLSLVFIAVSPALWCLSVKCQVQNRCRINAYWMKAYSF